LIIPLRPGGLIGWRSISFQWISTVRFVTPPGWTFLPHRPVPSFLSLVPSRPTQISGSAPSKISPPPLCPRPAAAPSRSTTADASPLRPPQPRLDSHACRRRSRLSHLPILTMRQWTSSRQSKKRMDRRLSKGPHLQGQEIIERWIPAWTKAVDLRAQL
jgi:hypothetical protein